MSSNDDLVFQGFRKTKLGLALEESLKELENNDLVGEEFSDNVLSEYDKSILSNLKRVDNKITFKGDCRTFKVMGNVSSFVLNNVELKNFDNNLLNKHGTYNHNDSKSKKLKLVIIERQSGNSRKKKSRR